MKVYCIINSHTGEFFKTDRGHVTFPTPQAAASAFNYTRRNRYRMPDRPKLKDQDVWVRKAVLLTPEALTDG